MKVKELIEILQMFNEELDVGIFNEELEGYDWLDKTGIEEINLSDYSFIGIEGNGVYILEMVENK